MYLESSKINLNYMKFFLVAAESKSISEAAEKLGYSVSTVSTNISTLENQLGVRLFFRDPLKMTEIGQQIYKALKKAHREIEYASILAKKASNLSVNKLSIGCQPHILKIFLIDKIEKALKENNNLKIDINSELSCRKIIRKIKDNQLDFALINFIPTDEELNQFEIKKIFKSQYILVSKNKIKVKNLSELEKYNYIISYDYRSSAIALKNYLKKYNIELNTVIQCSDMEARIEFAKKGMGTAYVLKDAVKKELNNKELYEVKLPIELPESTISLIYSKEHLTKIDKKFIKEYLQDKN